MKITDTTSVEQNLINVGYSPPLNIADISEINKTLAELNATLKVIGAEHRYYGSEVNSEEAEIRKRILSLSRMVEIFYMRAVTTQQ